MNETPEPSQPLTALPTRPRMRPRLGVVVFLALYLVLLITARWLSGIDALSPQMTAWFTVVRYAVLAAVGLWVFRSALVRSAGLARAHPWRTVLWTLVAIVGGELAPLIPALLLSWLGWLPESMANEDAAAALGDRVPAVVFFITLAVLGPITEELVFREVLVHRVRSVIPVGAALVISSLLFGLLHIRTAEELPLVLIYGSVGLVYGLVLVATKGNILVPMIGHAVHNGVPALGVVL